MKPAFFVLLLVAISLVRAGRDGGRRIDLRKRNMHILEGINYRCRTNLGCCYPQQNDDFNACSQGCPFKVQVIEEINKCCGTDFDGRYPDIVRPTEWWKRTCSCVQGLEGHYYGVPVISR